MTEAPEQMWEPRTNRLVYRSKRWTVILISLMVAVILAFVLYAGPELFGEVEQRSYGRRGRGIEGLIERYPTEAYWLFVTFLAGILSLLTIRAIKPDELVVADEGFSYKRVIGRNMAYRWTDISPIVLTKRKLAGNRQKVFEFFELDDVTADPKRVPAYFSLKGELLTDLMNDRRQQALSPDYDPIPTEGAAMSPSPDAQKPAMDDWQPPAPEGYAIREERAPYGRYAFYALLLGLVAAGGIWLASQVVVSDDLPEDRARIDLPAEEPSEAPPMGADEAAWVRALERDTLEGYRDYLAEFPEGRYADKAQEEIDAYDNRVWATAEQRNTIAGYEDYLADWEDGLHADKAREQIAEMKAALDAAAADAAERAARERADWETAARENTVASYETYLSQHPTGRNADEARARIAALQATAADNAAWAAAEAAATADAYQQYLTSFPQGAYVPQAIEALERLRPAVGRTFKDCDACPTMTVLPGGNDILGALDTDAEARPNEKPARPVNFGSPFAIGVREVTFAEYDACVAAGGCSGRPDDKGWGRGSRPVINVSFAEAQAYAQWLSTTTGFAYSLPTEAQWEYAARAGADDLYPGGSLAALCAFANGASQETNVAWANEACTDPGVGRTLPAGSLSANRFGLRDMIGNVQEWTLDCNTLNLRDAPVDGGADSRGSCGQRAVRGGSWFSGPDDLRYSARQMLRRGDRNDFTGFRVVRRLDG